MNPVARLGEAVSVAFRRAAPDPFVIAILLSLLAAVLALAFGFPPSEGQSWLESRSAAAAKLLNGWRGDSGIWKLLAFGMQMCLVLLSGHALASAPPVRRLLDRLAAVPRSTRSAVVMVSLVACGAGLINWGFGLVVGAILAREVVRSLAARGVAANAAMIAAAGYTCMMVWHGGLSGSAPLSVVSLEASTKTMAPDAAARLVGEGIPLTATLFSPLNLVITGGLLLLVPLTLALMAPSVDGRATPRDDRSERGVAEDPASLGPATSVPEWLERSPWLSLALAAALLVGLAGANWRLFGLNDFNALMMALGLVLHGSPMRWMRSVEDGAKGCAGIVVQFPLYGGIMIMLDSSGLAARFAETLTTGDSPRLVPVLSFTAACVLNLFIPSGGGQWAVQGPIALEAGQAVGVPAGEMVMSVAYGDQLTNMLQPFWALPLLAITGQRASQIVGYTTVVMLVGYVWIAGVLVLWG